MSGQAQDLEVALESEFMALETRAAGIKAASKLFVDVKGGRQLGTMVTTRGSVELRLARLADSSQAAPCPSERRREQHAQLRAALSESESELGREQLRLLVERLRSSLGWNPRSLHRRP